MALIVCLIGMVPGAGWSLEPHAQTSLPQILINAWIFCQPRQQYYRSPIMLLNTVFYICIDPCTSGLDLFSRTTNLRVGKVFTLDKTI